MGNAAVCVRMTEEEYLALERASQERHEYADGEIFAMAGGTLEHSNIAANIIRRIGEALSDQKCRVQSSDMRIYIPASGRYVYPDASVLCGRAEFKDDKRDTLLNPRVIVEVLSPSSEAYDRGSKFAQYRSILSVVHYVIAAHDTARIEVFTRQDDGAWVLRTYGLGEGAALPAIGISLDVSQVYANIFESGPLGGEPGEGAVSSSGASVDPRE